MTLQEIRRALAVCGITVGLSTVHRFLAAHNLTLKKRFFRAFGAEGVLWERVRVRRW
jgi:hypothetical protein